MDWTHWPFQDIQLARDRCLRQGQGDDALTILLNHRRAQQAKSEKFKSAVSLQQIKEKVATWKVEQKQINEKESENNAMNRLLQSATAGAGTEEVIVEAGFVVVYMFVCMSWVLDVHRFL